MSVPQLYRTIRAIYSNRHINTAGGLARHFHWHLRKLLRQFPFEQRISQSRIIAKNPRCGVSALVNNQGMYDWDNMHLLQELLRNGGVLFDVGANIGSYTLVASEQPAAFVYAFEPHPSTCDHLRENIELNLRRNVVIYNLAVGQRDGYAALTDIPGSSTNHLAPEDELGDGTLRVPCIRLDTLCKRMGQQPDYLKIDVEGFELEVLNGLGSLLGVIKLILVEVSSREDLVHRLLHASGFHGPFVYDHDLKILGTFARGSRGDQIFVSQPFLTEMTTKGFSFPDDRPQDCRAHPP